MLTMFEIVFGGRICGHVLIPFVNFTVLTKQALCAHRIATICRGLIYGALYIGVLCIVPYIM